MTQNREQEHETVYGKSFALYGRQEIEEFMAPLVERFRVNGIDPEKTFANKHCLDAGCGNGRGAIFMMESGAISVQTIDVSPTNIESTKKNLELFGHEKFSCQQGSIEDLPFENETFDFVWCNGVVMHTANPDKCLSELSRVLKVGGQAWIYVYGANGLYWYGIQRFRTALADINGDNLLSALQLMRYSVRHVAEFIDDWKTPYLRTYSAQDFNQRLQELGFSQAEPLKRGVVYDTSERRSKYPESATWVGEGDLRYLLTKTENAGPAMNPISDSEYGSSVAFDSEIIDRFEPLFDAAFAAVGQSQVAQIALCAYIHKALRDLLSVEGGFDIDKVESEIVTATNHARQMLLS